jgi:tetratricopeptide (TPR) repeat protein
MLVVSLYAQFANGQQQDPDRQRALQLYSEGKYKEALPLFEKLETIHRDDPEVLEKFAWLLLNTNDSVKDPVARKAARKRARDLLVRAQKAGANSLLAATMIETVPEDGGDDSQFAFSSKKEVDEAMHQGEAAFAKKEFPTAIEMYQRALLLDPKMYEAALYIGDVYFVTAEQRKAAEWFAKAIEIDPDRETAYRYWGDSLMKQARVTEAGDKFVEAYIAEPYSRLSNSGLISWANKVAIQLAHPKVVIPTSVTPQQNGNTTINIDPNSLAKDDKSGSGVAWVTYGLVRASWQSEFAKQYPEEKTYRHSLKEELSALRAALKVLSEQKNVDQKDIDPSLQTVAKLDKEGLLESYILLAMPDAGIAKDFKTYRRGNVDKLRRYVVDYVMTGGVGKD